jgi:hypothetical protein
MFAAAALLGAGALSASASPNPTSCQSAAGYMACTVLGTNGPANTLVASYGKVANEVLSGLLNPGNQPI